MPAPFVTMHSLTTTGAPSQSFSDAQQPETTGLSYVDVDTLATTLDLSTDDRATLHKFNQSSPCVQNIMYFSTVLAQARRIEGIEAMCARLYVHYKHLGTLIKEDWAPSDAEKICAHTKPGSLPLLQLTRHFLQEHWIGAVEDPPNEFHLYSIANFRDIACRIQDQATMTVTSSEDLPLVTTQPEDNEDVLTDQQVAATRESMVSKSRGVDAGFWRMVEDELEERIAEFGYSRNAPEWVNWRQIIIKRDQDRFGTPTSLVLNNAQFLTQNDERDRVHSRESDFAFVQSLNLV
ncbi:hypothetical protein FRC09_004373 [Ceratobasidium sp. 395]|nr:hypothetical protein FRC09_004373 [Ceratobasidium sp. 395]